MRIFLDSARRAARLGTDIIKKWLGKDFVVSLKSPADQVTQVDLEIEDAIVGLIKKQHPGHAVLAEETHGSMDLLNEKDLMVWVIDPLDGTANFIHGWPMVAVSIALVQNRVPLVGVVRHGIFEEEFWAIRNGGARLNSSQISVSPCKQLNQALCATAFPFRKRALMPSYLKLFSRMYEQIEDIRRGGSAALDLAYVAAGRIDAYWEIGLKPWDIAAGMLLVEEAGGVVSSFSGGGSDLLRGDIVASNHTLHGQLCQFTSPWWQKNMENHAGPY